MSDRQKVFYAILASIFVHIAIVAGLYAWTVLWVARHPPVATLPHPDLSRLVVTLMPPKVDVEEKLRLAPTPTPTPRPFIRPTLDSDGLTASTKAPDHALFQSDSNMIAGSLLPATGNIPLPSEAGTRRNFMEFEKRPVSVGKGEQPSEVSRARREAEAAQSMPLQTPYAVTQVQHPPAQASTPAPIATPPPDSLAIGTPTPTPAPVADLARLTLRAHADIAPMMQTAPARPAPPTPQSAPMPPAAAEPSTQRETTRTQIDGNIVTQSAPAVDAAQTPYGRYRHRLSNIIGSRWQLYLQEHPKDVGDVMIDVKIAPSGKVIAARVNANHSVDDLAAFSTTVIMESDLPPIPDDLAPMLRDGSLEIPFHFTVYDASNDSPGR